MNKNDDLIFSRQITDFLTVANEYCHLVEESSSFPPGHLLAYLQRVLPLLYIKGSLLPVVETTDPEQLVRYYTEEQWENTFNTLRGILGKHDAFWEITHPDDHEIPQPEKGSIAEYLTDLHQEMKDFIMLFQQPLTTTKEAAVASCRALFYDHWGAKALQTAMMIHHAIYPCCSDQNFQD